MSSTAAAFFPALRMPARSVALSIRATILKLISIAEWLWYKARRSESMRLANSVAFTWMDGWCKDSGRGSKSGSVAADKAVLIDG